MTTQTDSINAQAVNPRITLGIFGLLFVIRLIGGYLQATAQRNSDPFFIYFYVTVSLTFVTVIIWLNKENISGLNVDRYFIYVFTVSCTLLFLYFGLSFLGIVATSGIVLVLRLLITKRLALKDKESNYRLIFFVVLGIASVLLLKLLAREFSTYIDPYLKLNANEIFVIVTLRFWDVIFEEILFRGTLWMLLTKWNLSNKKVVITQAFMFWLVHLNSMSGVSFGIVIFLIGLWFGFLVLRSKSLVPSTLAHFVWNIMSDL